MPSDISADVAYIAGGLCEGILYGIHLIVFGVVCLILLSKPYKRGPGTSAITLLAFSTFMFILSTAHVALAFQEILLGFVYQDHLEGNPQDFFRNMVFPQRKALYIINTLLGDSLLIWRVYVIWGRKWKICALPLLFLVATTTCGVKTIVANAISSGHSVFNPSILSWVTSTFVLNIVTQVTSTGLIATKIYRAASTGSRNSSRYMSLVWLVVESGAIYTAAAIVQLVTYLLKLNVGVILEMMLAQLSAIAPALILIRIGLGVAYEGTKDTKREDAVLTTFHDTMPPSIASRGQSLPARSVTETSISATLADNGFPAEYPVPRQYTKS